MAVSNTAGALAEVALIVVVSVTPLVAVEGKVILTVTGPLPPGASIIESGLGLTVKP